MHNSKKALIFAAAISLVSDVISGVRGNRESFDELIDCLEILGLDSHKIISLPPIQALHIISSEFAKIEVSETTLKEIQEGVA